MQRMCGDFARVVLLSSVLLVAGSAMPARADLIRAAPGRAFPDIAGDIGGSQTYVYDPATQTGTFALINAPHLISLGPSGKDLIPMRPDRDGTLSQSLALKLDCSGHLIDSPLNRFEIRGTVVINDREYHGLLLSGQPTAFGIADKGRIAPRDPEAFGLNMRIDGGLLAGAFGPEAYLRIVPQANSTFQGEFTRDFSGDQPLTNLIALDRGFLSSGFVLESLAVAAVVGFVLLARSVARWSRRGTFVRRRTAAPWAASTW